MNIRNSFQRSIAILCATAFLASLLASSARTQEPSPPPTPTVTAPVGDKTELHQALLDLTNPFTVMCVAAHPDDEDGTTLTVLRRKYGAHTVSLFSTYGEGGQNAVGPELYEELGVIRAQETLKAAQIQGSEPYFLGLKDFGFSKSADEAFKVWGHDEALRRMVLKIRELRPDVIITNHDTTSGHGHHQATGRLIIEAFDAAADPKRFPELLNQAKPWQPQRLFVRIFGGASGQKPDSRREIERIVAIDPNEVDPVRGTSFAEQALAALQQHATQGPWPKTIDELLKARRIDSGKLPLIRYQLLREASGAPALPQNATTPLAGLELPESFAARVAPPKIDDRPLTDFFDQPDRVLETLVDWRASQPASERSSDDPYRLRLIEARVDRAIAIASGVSLTLDAPAVLVPGVNTTFSINIGNPGLRIVHLNELRFDGWGENLRLKAADQLFPDTEALVTVDKTTPKTATFTVPKEEHLYDGLFLGKRFRANAQLEVDGARFSVSTNITRDVAPAVEIKTISPSPYVWTPATLNQPLSFKVGLTNHLGSAFSGSLTIGNPQHRAFEAGRKLSLAPMETRQVTLKSNAIPFDTLQERSRPSAKFGQLLVAVEPEDASRPITERSVRVVYTDARVARGLRVGFVPSFDQTLASSLAALGVNAKELTIADIQKGELQAYDTIVIDNRGYEAHPELVAANTHLLDFVQAGGTLIVFYHKSNEWNPDPKKNRPQLAPYPIILADDRVTDETAPIKILQPRHPLLNLPNRITQADFVNWIQERGLYYPKEWDPHYIALFSTNDPSEPPLTGGLLVARYGKGNYIYTSMVWYRELRAGVPGAYRMFANMISYGHR
jgi:LmbE family N-acetylglucosaminyl deacetylase